MNANKIYSHAINFFGQEKQVLVTIEEMAELTKALLKNINRGEQNRDDILEELVDCEIMFEQIKRLYCFTIMEMENTRKAKLARLEDYISQKGDRQLAGSGSTLRASYELGRHSYGFEVEKSFYKDAKEKMLARMQQDLLIIQEKENMASEQIQLINFN
jgi:NTP pyrophosphatase (non-canonical NTP hydrolase)